MPELKPAEARSGTPVPDAGGRFGVQIRLVGLAFKDRLLVLTTRSGGGEAVLARIELTDDSQPEQALGAELGSWNLHPAALELLAAGIERSPDGTRLVLDFLALLGPATQQPSAAAALVPIDEALAALAEGEARLVEAARARASELLEDLGLAVGLVGQPFTLGDLRRVYIQARGDELNPSNFARTVLSAGAGYLRADPSGAKRAHAARPAALYVASGNAPRIRFAR